MAMKKLTKQAALKVVMEAAARPTAELFPILKEEEPQRNGTSTAEVMKRLINERLNGMTFLELALTLAHVMEKKDAK